MTTQEDMAGADEMTGKLEAEGYKNIQVVNFRPNQDAGMHLHETASVHIILVGNLIIEDSSGVKDHHKGERVDFPAGSRHRAKSGPHGLVMIIGSK